MGNQDFLARIKQILGARKKHAWGGNLGLKATRTGAMFEGRVPTADALERIHWADGVCLDWLLVGDGPMYLVHHHPDARVARRLRELDASWRCDLLVERSGAGDAALAVSRPGETRAYKDGVARYTAVRQYAVAGPQALAQLAEREGVRALRVSAGCLARVRAGRVGTYDLVGETGEGGLLGAAEPIGREELLALAARSGATESGPPADEAALIRAYRQLPSDGRQALLRLLEVAPARA